MVVINFAVMVYACPYNLDLVFSRVVRKTMPNGIACSLSFYCRLIPEINS